MFQYLFCVWVVLLLYAFYKWASQKHDFFLKKGIPHLKPYFLVGNTGGVFTRRLNTFELIIEHYKLAGSGKNKVFGIFDLTYPCLMICDPHMGKNLYVKHFEHFTDHRSVIDSKSENEIIGKSLIALSGQEWRDMRSTLSPVFTGSKLRLMFELICECADQTANFFVEKAKSEGKQVHEMKETFSRFATDVIASSAFGVSINSLEDRNNSFYNMVDHLLNVNRLVRMIKVILKAVFPKLMTKLRVKISSPETNNFFKSLVIDSMALREKNNIHRPDMIHLLMQVKKGNLTYQPEEAEKTEGFATVQESSVGKMSHKRHWDDDYLAAQCFMFFAAGFDTISSALSFLTYELAIDQDIQQRLYDEIAEVNSNLNGKPLSYEVIQKMQYLDMVVTETLRKWPPAPVLERICTKDFLYEDEENNIKFTIEKGSTIFMPIYAFHMDPKYYPNPEKFDPERFNEENKKNIDLSTYLPFGIGPRNCIGSRFALLEMKAILYQLLLQLSFEVCEKTQIPIKRGKIFQKVSEKGVWIELKPRTK